jgi:hypothetical protein
VHDSDDGALWRGYDGPAPQDIRIRLAVEATTRDDADQASREASRLLLRRARHLRRALACHATHPDKELSGPARPGADRNARTASAGVELMSDTTTIPCITIAAQAIRNALNLSLMPYDPADYDLLAEQVAAEKVLALFQPSRRHRVHALRSAAAARLQFRD